MPKPLWQMQISPFSELLFSPFQVLENMTMLFFSWNISNLLSTLAFLIELQSVMWRVRNRMMSVLAWALNWRVNVIWKLWLSMNTLILFRPQVAKQIESTSHMDNSTSIKKNIYISWSHFDLGSEIKYWNEHENPAKLRLKHILMWKDMRESLLFCGEVYPFNFAYPLHPR